ncbi:unnamed protein product [Peronospora belbahrii]|uniref:ZZ-type domain-containing protein n=1 Tax=Peronospora belbahrii TaxID=622444 RepID=A0ABN8D2T8_9STRA|nr:unnamed protein product [Peronospora belbahrii]
MLTTAMLQHNLAALQAQLAILQQENSVLTRDLCLKENYIQLKDQQFRMMQRRLEELEGIVAQWKDRWLQQVTVNQVKKNSDEGSNKEKSGREGGQINKVEDAQWTPYICKPKTTSRAKALAQANTMLETFFEADRNKLQSLLAVVKQRNCENVDDLVFTDVSEELSHILRLYVLPALLNAVDDSKQLQLFSRTYQKQTMDFKVSTTHAHGVTNSENATGDKLPPPAPSLLRSSSTEMFEESMVIGAQSAPETEEVNAPHLFDSVELDRRGAARAPVPHGPRELHATKAMFVSRPLSGPAAARAAIPSVDRLAEKLLDTPSRRYTMTPNRTGSMFAMETTRTYTMTMSALLSPAQSPSSMDVFSLGSDGDVIPMPPREKEGKDGKIKKIVGSVIDRLSRHKSQQSLTASSPSHASPVPFGMLVGSTDVEDETLCDGCGRGPLSGIKWVCRTCRLLADEEYDLCEKCYGQGIHGKEHESALFVRVETIVVRKCPHLATETELLHLLRVGICKANVKKFSFCLTWIADLLQCKRTTDLRARALEIANITPAVRSEFARLLRELLIRHRPDIDLKIKWEPAAGAQHRTLGPGGPAKCDEGAPEELDTLRIWVKDASLAATSSTETTSMETTLVC